jgi:type I restriction enzyme S subunit
MLQEDDVLVIIGGLGCKCGYVKAEHLPANTNQAVGIVRINKEKAVPRYVYYFFKQASTFALCQSLGGQAAQPNVNLRVLKSIKVPLPSLDIQETITSILSAYDDLIENNRRRIALLEEAARQLYREWFVRLRFPGHEHTPSVASGGVDRCRSRTL